MHSYQITRQIAADRQADMRADAARRTIARQARDARRAQADAEAPRPVRRVAPLRRRLLALLPRTAA